MGDWSFSFCNVFFPIIIIIKQSLKKIALGVWSLVGSGCKKRSRERERGHKDSERQSWWPTLVVLGGLPGSPPADAPQAQGASWGTESLEVCPPCWKASDVSSSSSLSRCLSFSFDALGTLSWGCWRGAATPLSLHPDQGNPRLRGEEAGWKCSWENELGSLRWCKRLSTPWKRSL